MIRSWHSGTAVIRLLRASAADDGDSDRVLTEEERTRAQRFHFENDRVLWTAGRRMLRRLLGEATGKSPQEVTILTDPGGKPFVEGGPPFNLSHSGDHVVIAIGTLTPVGIDVEPLNREVSALELAARYFLPHELEALKLCDDDACGRLFIRLWTAKEALMKATGMGMRLAPDRISVILESALPVVVTRVDTGESWPVDSREVDGCCVSFVELAPPQLRDGVEA